MKLKITIDVYTSDDEVDEAGKDKRLVVVDAVKAGRFDIIHTLEDE